LTEARFEHEAIVVHRIQTFSNSAIRECDKLAAQNYYSYRTRGALSSL